MVDDAMNLPVEEQAEEKVETFVEEKEKQAEMPIEEPVEEKTEEVAPVVAVPLKKRIKSNSTLVNVRDGVEGEVLFRIQNGTPIVVEEDLGDWVKISGYVLKALVGDR
jgi:hypothetical protein